MFTFYQTKRTATIFIFDLNLKKKIQPFARNYGAERTIFAFDFVKCLVNYESEINCVSKFFQRKNKDFRRKSYGNPF